jgi:hypothetical protein
MCERDLSIVCSAAANIGPIYSEDYLTPTIENLIGPAVNGTSGNGCDDSSYLGTARKTFTAGSRLLVRRFTHERALNSFTPACDKAHRKDQHSGRIQIRSACDQPSPPAFQKTSLRLV